MKIVRITLTAILIVGFIGIIPRSWSRAASHTETPAANDSTNSMSSGEKCEEKNYKRFERCMLPCHKENREENYYKALKLYEKPTTFEGTDIVFGYCMKICQESVERIDCDDRQDTTATDAILIDTTGMTVRIQFKNQAGETKIIKTERGSLIAQSESARKPYVAPKNINEVKAVLREVPTGVTSIQKAYEYLLRARKDFPTYKKSDYFSKDAEQQLERAMNRERGELLDLESYFGKLSSNFDNAQWWLRKAVHEGVDNETIQNEIQRRDTEFITTVNTNEARGIRNNFPHFNFMTAMNQYFNQLQSPDPSTELIGQARNK